MTTTASTILEAAAGHLRDRAKTYDKEATGGERSIAATVEAFRAVTGDGKMDTPERGWLFMELLKMVRSQQGDYRPDNYEDATAYAALRGEAAYQAHVAAGQRDLFVGVDMASGPDQTVIVKVDPSPWYPDDRPGWVEIKPGDYPNLPEDTKVEALALHERGGRTYQKTIMPVRDWHFRDGHLCAYRVRIG